MATYVKLRGLSRDRAVGDTGITGGRGVRVRLPFKQAEGGTSMVKASYTPTANVVLYTAAGNGAWGNNVSVVHATGGAAVPVVTVTYPTGGSPNPTITVTGTAATTPASVVSAVNSHPVAGNLVVASVAGSGAGTFAAVGTTALSSGADGTGSTLYPLHARLTQLATVVVDVDDPFVARALRRNPKGWLSLGAQ